jgi:hypothetical protein
MGAPKIFVSMGTPYSEQYVQFREALETFLRDSCKADPRIIGKNEYPPGNPLESIRDVMKTCDGVVVVAYERKYLETGVEKRASNSPIKIAKQTYTTPWNHIESAIAYGLGIPLYIICETGVAQEGLIETKLDWQVQTTAINKDTFSRPEIAQTIRSWVDQRVFPRSKRRARLWRAFTGNLQISEMTFVELWAPISVVTAAFALGVAASHLLPRLFPDP